MFHRQALWPAPTQNLTTVVMLRIVECLTPGRNIRYTALLCRTFFSWSSFAFATASAAFVLMESISTALVCVTSWSSSLRFFIVAPNAPTSWCCSTKSWSFLTCQSLALATTIELFGFSTIATFQGGHHAGGGWRDAAGAWWMVIGV